MNGLLRRVRHLTSALLVVGGGVAAASFLALDIAGVGQVILPGLGGVDSRLLALIVILGTAIAAAGKLAEANMRLEDLVGEERTYGQAPLISWIDPRLFYYDDGTIAFHVWCENSGPLESVATFIQFRCFGDDLNTVYSRGASRVAEGYDLATPLGMWNPIKSHKLGAEHRFEIVVRSRPGRDTGEREIVWMMVYSDRANPKIAYVTQASLRANFQTPGKVQPIPGTLFLDATSTPQTRRQRYLDDAAHGNVVVSRQ